VKALSLWQPWASAIALGLKSVETRSWATTYRGPLAIHAAQRRLDDDEERDLYARIAELDGAAARTAPEWRAHRGVVVATCQLTMILGTREAVERGMIDERERRWGDFAPGRYAWFLGDVVRPEQPAPARGRQGLWEWTP
jgi:hypothetical protein